MSLLFCFICCFVLLLFCSDVRCYIFQSKRMLFDSYTYKVGTTSDSTRATCKGKTQGRFCVAYGMKQSATFALSWDAVEFKALATLWCHKMQNFCNIFLAHGAGYEFTDDDYAEVSLWEPPHIDLLQHSPTVSADFFVATGRDTGN